MGNYEVMKLDVNNDMQEDDIIALHARTHAEDDDTFYVYDSRPVSDEPKNVDPDSKESFYRQSASRVVPDAWGLWPGHVQAPWWDPSDKPEFRPQYLYLEPFRWEGVTYFMTGSAEVDKRHWHLILRPEPNNSVTTMCAFQVVQERY